MLVEDGFIFRVPSTVVSSGLRAASVSISLMRGTFINWLESARKIRNSTAPFDLTFLIVRLRSNMKQYKAHATVGLA